MNKTSLIAILSAFFILAFAGYMAWNYFKSEPNNTQNQQGEAQPLSSSESSNSSTLSGVVPGERSKIYSLPVLENLGRRGLGNPNAPVILKEFFSLTCNHCANFHQEVFPAIKSKYIDTGKVYFVFEEFPLNGPALYGSMIARCMPEDRYASFIDLLFKNQDKWAFSGDFKDSLKQNAALAGMGEEEFEQCFADKDLQRDMATNIKNASENWNVSSTPTFVFNDGERILRGGQSFDQFERVYQHLTASSIQE